jgi:hypothetical protein
VDESEPVDEYLGQRTVSIMLDAHGRRIDKTEQRIDEQQTQIDELVQDNADTPDEK